MLLLHFCSQHFHMMRQFTLALTSSTFPLVPRNFYNTFWSLGQLSSNTMCPSISSNSAGRAAGSATHGEPLLCVLHCCLVNIITWIGNRSMPHT